MIDRDHNLPVSKQAEVLRISRGSIYYLPRPLSAADLALMRRLDELHLEFPFAGSRMLRGLVAAEGCKVGRRHVKTLMRRMGIEALYRQRQLADLRVQRLYIDGGSGRCDASGSEHVGSPALQLRFPCCDLVGMNVELLRQLSQRPIASDGGERHFRLESRCVVPARSSAHRLS